MRNSIFVRRAILVAVLLITAIVIPSVAQNLDPMEVPRYTAAIELQSACDVAIGMLDVERQENVELYSAKKPDQSVEAVQALFWAASRSMKARLAKYAAH